MGRTYSMTGLTILDQVDAVQLVTLASVVSRVQTQVSSNAHAWLAQLAPL